MGSVNYVVITPVRNEVEFVGRTIQSMASQTMTPQQWVIVDDGSSDGTGDVLAAATERHAWIKVVRRKDRGFRHSGSGVVQAFEDGLAAVDAPDWQFLVKLDGDLAFDADYFAASLGHFAKDPSLGIAGGVVYVSVDGQWKVDSPGDPPFHVRGATKIYRRACWEQISPLPAYPGWDTIDEVKANMHGWRTRSLRGIPLYQQRATGGADGAWRNWLKNGLANYVTGYHPLFMLGKCVKRLWGAPPVVPAIALWLGFCSGYVRRGPRLREMDVVRYLRQQQLRRLFMRSSIYSAPRAGRS